MVDFSGASTACIAPHIRHTQAFVHILSETAKDDSAVSMAGFQNVHNDETKVLSGKGDLCEKILGCYSSMCTVILLASAAHAFIFGRGSAAALLRDVPQRQASGHGEPAAMALEAPIALVNLKSSLDEFEAHLRDDCLPPSDLTGLRLCRSVGFCAQWAAQMRTFCFGALAEMFKLAARTLHDMAEGLDSAIPRWGALFPANQEIGISLVTAKILNHPKRASVPTTVRHIKKTLAELDKVSMAMGGNIKLEGSIDSIVKSTLSTAENYLLICAGTHTICHPGSATYAKNAQDILDIAARTTSFDLPDSLRAALQLATLGKAALPAQSVGAVKRQPGDGSGDTAQPDSKRAKVEPASSGPGSGAGDGDVSPSSGAGSSSAGAVQSVATATGETGVGAPTPKAPAARRGLRALRQRRAPTT